jgi:hypothetical protein
MKIPSRNHLRQSGSTLMTTLVILGITGFLMITYLTLTQSQSQSTMRSQAWNLSMAMVEAGMEEAMAHLNVNGSNTLAGDGWAQTGTGYTRSRWLGQNYYIVSVTNYIPGSNAINPTIVSRGYVPLLAPLASAGSPVMFADFTGGAQGSAYVGRGVRVTLGNDRLFARGMVAKDTIVLNGNNIATDSFDSSDPRYSTNGLYDPRFRRANGDVASTAGITNAINIGNANIRGHVATGPKGTVSLGPNGTVGDLDWVNAGNTGIQPGYVMNDMNMTFPDVKPPFNGGAFTPTKLNPPQSVTTTNFVVSSNGTSVASISLPVAGYVSVTTNTVYATAWPTNSPGPISTNKAGTKIKGYYYPVFTATYSGVVTNAVVVASEATYDYIIDDGNWQIGQLDGSVYVSGNAVLYVTDTLSIDALTIKPGKSLNLYSAAPSASLTGNNTLNSDGFAGSFKFWGLPSCTTVTFSGNAGFTGTIYAPQADFTFNGGGNDTTDFIGASVTKSVNMNGHFNFHYDEILGRTGPSRGYYITSWVELDPHEVPLVKRW